MYNNQYMIDNLNRQKDRIDEMIRNYQQPTPVNNFINTNQTPNPSLYDLKVLNDGDEVENIFVGNNTIFMGINRMQIKKTDGTIEKYDIVKTYPIDKKDEKINELEEKLKEMEMKLNEYSKSNGTTRSIKQSDESNDVNVKSEPKTDSKSISK